LIGICNHDLLAWDFDLNPNNASFILIKIANYVNIESFLELKFSTIKLFPQALICKLKPCA